MKTQRTSYAFLTEMLWICGFFVLCACIFVLVFVKSEQLSRKADLLNQAVLAVSNTMEESFADISSEDPLKIPLKYSNEDFSIIVERRMDNDLLSLTVKAISPNDGTILYSLSGARALEKGGIQ